MPPRKPAKPEFPPECCYVCSYCEIDDKQLALCWVDPPEIIDTAEDGAPIYARGKPIDAQWRVCRDFKPRLHG